MKKLLVLFLLLVSTMALLACNSTEEYNRKHRPSGNLPDYYDYLIYNDQYIHIFTKKLGHEWLSNAFDEQKYKAFYEKSVAELMKEKNLSEEKAKEAVEARNAIITRSLKETDHCFFNIGFKSIRSFEITGPGVLTLVFQDDSQEVTVKDQGIMFTDGNFWGWGGDTVNCSDQKPFLVNSTVSKLGLPNNPPQQAFIRLPKSVEGLALIKISINRDRVKIRTSDDGDIAVVNPNKGGS